LKTSLLTSLGVGEDFEKYGFRDSDKKAVKVIETLLHTNEVNTHFPNLESKASPTVVHRAPPPPCTPENH
jgi:hypothetical protein